MKSKRIAALVLTSGLVGCTTTQQEVKKEEPVVTQVKEKTTREVFAESVKAFDAGDFAAAKEGFSKRGSPGPQGWQRKWLSSGASYAVG